MKTIPQIRERLNEIANKQLSLAAETQKLSNELKRRSPVRRAANTSKPMTPALAEAIRHHGKAFPTASYGEIGRLFNVNTGRVSEAIAGKR